MKKWTLVIPDGLHPEGMKILQQSGYFNVSTNIKDLNDQQAHGLIVHVTTPVNAQLLKSVRSHLKLVATVSSGLDHIDVDCLEKMKIPLIHARGLNADSVAELVLWFLLLEARHGLRAVESMHQGHWIKSQLQGVELKSRSLGILGLGFVGTRLAQLAQVLGMKILAYDPLYSSEKPAPGAELLNIIYTESELEVARQVDFLSLHCPLTTSTQTMISRSFLDQVPSQLVLMNTARGELVDAQAVLSALDSGRLKHYYADVFEKEPLDQESRLRSHSRVTLTPHIGGATYEARVRMAVHVAQKVIDAFLCDKAAGEIIP